MTLTLSVVICTRDRAADLARCAASLGQCPTAGFARVDVIVVDDGARGTSFDALGPSVGSMSLTTVQNGARGLFSARLSGLAASRGDVVLFLDDDVTLAADYLTELAAAYARHPGAAGIGGVDQTDVPRSRGLRVLHRLFLYDSGRPGVLSSSGFPGSTRRWIAQNEDFPSEYLHGCNMSFRRTALASLRAIDWLTGYSLGEDLHVSRVARAAGPLIVSPRLRVWHRQSAAARDGVAATGRAQAVNMFHLLRARDRSVRGVLAFAWTMTWYILKDGIRAKRRHLVPGYLRGLVDLLRSDHGWPTA